MARKKKTLSELQKESKALLLDIGKREREIVKMEQKMWKIEKNMDLEQQKLDDLSRIADRKDFEVVKLYKKYDELGIAIKELQKKSSAKA